jgi:hypothetical protein
MPLGAIRLVAYHHEGRLRPAHVDRGGAWGVAPEDTHLRFGVRAPLHVARPLAGLPLRRSCSGRRGSAEGPAYGCGGRSWGREDVKT